MLKLLGIILTVSIIASVISVIILIRRKEQKEKFGITMKK